MTVVVTIGNFDHDDPVLVDDELALTEVVVDELDGGVFSVSFVFVRSLPSLDEVLDRSVDWAVVLHLGPPLLLGEWHLDLPRDDISGGDGSEVDALVPNHLELLGEPAKLTHINHTRSGVPGLKILIEHVLSRLVYKFNCQC